MPARGVEHDLVDAHVRGKLIGNTQKQFESFYLSTPYRQEKVMLARSLRERLSRTNAIV